jgi:hypothetical protein
MEPYGSTSMKSNLNLETVDSNDSLYISIPESFLFAFSTICLKEPKLLSLATEWMPVSLLALSALIPVAPNPSRYNLGFSVFRSDMVKSLFSFCEKFKKPVEIFPGPFASNAGFSCPVISISIFPSL